MKDYKELSRIEFNKQAEKFDTAKNYYKVCQDSHDPANKEVAKEPFKNFLDMGCGTGNTIESLIKKLPRCALYWY